MSDRRKAILVLSLMFALAVWSFVFFRATYNHAKRLRVVVPGKFYRAGQLTADGFADAVQRFGIRTIVNVQDDVPDPLIWHNYVDRRAVRETEVCKQLGVRYVWLAPDLVPPQQAQRGHRPIVIEEFVKLCDDPSIYPVLLHCKAGLHRTGLLTAIYRMEFQGWSKLRAFREMRSHGFGDWVSTSANQYVDQYLLRYEPRAPRPVVTARHQPN